MAGSSKYTVELLLDCKAQIGEAPFFDETTNQLIWVDIRGCTINFLDIATNENRSLRMPDTVSAAIPVEGSKNMLAVLLGKSICLVDKNTGSVTTLAEVDADKPDNRFNDGKCDSSGRLWCGTMERILRWEGSKPAMPTPNVGALYSYSAGEVVKQLGDLTVSNGMAWSPDNSKMYFIETFSQKVNAFDFDGRTGTLSNQRVAVDYAQDKSLGFPDGMCTDAQGRLWVCGFYGPGVTCFDPDTGKQLAQIPIPTVNNVTSCCFGGPDYSWLFVTSASFATAEDEWKTYLHSGGVFVIKDIGTKGTAAYRFRE